MKKIFLFVVVLLFAINTKAQERVITTGVPFLLVAADARSGGLGDQGVATTPDAFSQQWNPAKFAFVTKQMGFTSSYTPYLIGLVNDISLGQLSYYNRFQERMAFAASLRYFALGEIELRQNFDDPANIVKPNELAIDGSYSLQLSPKFAMGIGGRFISSSLKIPDVNNDARAAKTFAVDISGFYQSEEHAYNSFNGRLRYGFNFQNLGPKINYDASLVDKTANFLPANMKVGAGYDFAFDEFSKLTVNVEFAKLLVPTPQLVGDRNKDGVAEEATDKFLANQEYQSINWTSGIFKSFNDAPGGFKEELREFTSSLSTEYNYQDAFALRLGYFYEDPNKGARKFFTLGAGFKYSAVKVDVSYLFNASKIRSPLENTLRFSLTIGFGDDYPN